MKPANSIAEKIKLLRIDNGFYQEQIDKNLDLISQLAPLAEWSDEPEPEPEIET
jgi:hypothetical protein